MYSSLNCTSGYHYIGLSPEVQKKSAFVTPINKFDLMIGPFGLGQAPVHFKQLIIEVPKGFLFASGYLNAVFVLIENDENTLDI